MRHDMLHARARLGDMLARARCTTGACCAVATRWCATACAGLSLRKAETMGAGSSSTSTAGSACEYMR